MLPIRARTRVRKFKCARTQTRACQGWLSRRSPSLSSLLTQFLHVFGSSPDETAFFRIYLLTEGTINNVLMIQPSLLAFSFNHPPGPGFLPALLAACPPCCPPCFRPPLRSMRTCLAIRPPSRNRLPLLLLPPSLAALHSAHLTHTAVLLDVSSITPDRILLLDTYFNVVVFHGVVVVDVVGCTRASLVHALVRERGRELM